MCLVGRYPVGKMDACKQVRRLLSGNKVKTLFGVICEINVITGEKAKFANFTNIILFTDYSHKLCDPRMSAFPRKNMKIVFELFTLVCRQPYF